LALGQRVVCKTYRNLLLSQQKDKSFALFKRTQLRMHPIHEEESNGQRANVHIKDEPAHPLLVHETNSMDPKKKERGRDKLVFRKRRQLHSHYLSVSFVGLSASV
jgi:hypothetical protein